MSFISTLLSLSPSTPHQQQLHRIATFINAGQHTSQQHSYITTHLDGFSSLLPYYQWGSPNQRELYSKYKAKYHLHSQPLFLYSDSNTFSYCKLFCYLMHERHRAIQCHTTHHIHSMFSMIGEYTINISIDVVLKTIVCCCEQDTPLYTQYWVSLLLHFPRPKVIELFQVHLLQAMVGVQPQLQIHQDYSAFCSTYSNYGSINALASTPLQPLHSHIIPYPYSYCRMVAMYIHHTSAEGMPWVHMHEVERQKISHHEQKKEQAALHKLMQVMECMGYQETFSTHKDYLFDAQFNRVFALALMTHFILINDYTNFCAIKGNTHFEITLHVPLLIAFSRLLDWIISPLLFTFNYNQYKRILPTSTDFFPQGYFKQCHAIDSLLFGQLSLLLLHCSLYIGLTPLVYTKVIRLCKHTIANHPSYTPHVYSLVQQALFPALSCCNKNSAASFQLYDLIRMFAWDMRYALYSYRCKETNGAWYRVQQYAEMIERMKNTSCQGRNAKKYMNRMSKAIHNMPIEGMTQLISLIHIDENSMCLMHCITPLSRDVCMWILCAKMYEQITIKELYIVMELIGICGEWNPFMEVVRNAIQNKLIRGEEKKIKEMMGRAVERIRNGKKYWCAETIVKNMHSAIKYHGSQEKDVESTAQEND